MFGSSHLRPQQNTTTAGQTRPSQNRRYVASRDGPSGMGRPRESCRWRLRGWHTSRVAVESDGRLSLSRASDFTGCP